MKLTLYYAPQTCALVPFVTLTDQDIRRGDLLSRVDVVVRPDQAPDRLMNGHPDGIMPPEYTGGLTAAGALVVSEAIDDLTPFVPNEHIVVAPRDSLAQCILKYLDDQEARERITRGARDLIRTSMRIEDRARTIAAATGLLEGSFSLDGR